MSLESAVARGRFAPFNHHAAASKLPATAPQLFADFLGLVGADAKLVGMFHHQPAQPRLVNFAPRPGLCKKLPELEQGEVEGVQVQAVDGAKVDLVQSRHYRFGGLGD